MRRLLLRLSWSLLTFATSAAVVNFHRNAKPPMMFGPAEAHLNSTKPVYRCDETPDLPLPIKVLLNRNFPGWSFPEVSDDDCYSVKQSDPQAYAQLIKGDFNDDGRLDYAILIQQSAEATDKGVARPLIVHVVAFFRKPDGYKMQPVTSEAVGCLMLMRKGDRDYDYEAQREFTYPRDTIFSGFGMGGTSYLYENGKFRAIITSD